MHAIPKLISANKIIIYKYDSTENINPLMPRRTLVSPFTEISILFQEGIIKKKKIPMSVAPMSR